MREVLDGGPEVSLRSTPGYWMSSLRDGEEESVLRTRIWDMGRDIAVYGRGYGICGYEICGYGILGQGIGGTLNFKR